MIKYLTFYSHPIPIMIPGGPSNGKLTFIVGEHQTHATRIEQEAGEVRIYTRYEHHVVCVNGGYGFFTEQGQVAPRKEAEKKAALKENGGKGGRAPKAAPAGLVQGGNDKKTQKEKNDEAKALEKSQREDAK